ncbi:MAG: TrmH family RNA methyltransferase [Frankiaceae bacterium]
MRHAAPVTVTDPADPRLVDYQSLTDVALRTRVEPAAGLFIAEGELVIGRALRAGYRPRSVLLAPRWLDQLRPLLAEAAPGAPVYLAEEDVLERVTGFHVHRGALAAFERKPLPEPAELLASACRVVVAENVNNPTNLGAVLRSAAALGMDALLLDPRSCDPLYRRSVRVSMGEALAVPHARLAGWPGALAAVREAGFRLLALTPDPAAVPIEDVRPGPDDRVAVLLGAEGPGLTAGALAEADEAVRIPMAPGVDSLNVAAAAAVAFYVLGRR